MPNPNIGMAEAMNRARVTGVVCGGVFGGGGGVVGVVGGGGGAVENFLLLKGLIMDFSFNLFVPRH